ncbi:MAG: RIP metalloprotease RseP [Bacteroidales bacterium]|nr:RIP metalloprotease RseP [Bacteroidales bacterium]
MIVLIKTLQVILALSILILVHEFGHFFFAKIFGIRVDKFYLFFDAGDFKLLSTKSGWFARLFPKAKEWETEYGIGWLPLGGYCKIAGMIDESMDTEHLKTEPQSWEFRSKPAWQRLFVMAGGVLFNFILAILIYSGILSIWGESYISNEDNCIYVNELAYDMGFRNGDRILSFDDYVPENFGMLQANLARENASKAVVLRDGDTINIYIDHNRMGDILNTPGMFDLARPFIVDQVPESSPNHKAGLMEDDRIIGIDSTCIRFVQDAEPVLSARAGETVRTAILRGDDTLAISLQVDTLGKFGIYTKVQGIKTKEYNLISAIPAGFSKTFSTIGGYLKDLKLIFTPSTEAYKSVGSFIAMGQIFPSAWDWYSFLNILALLSIMLGVMNLIPIPALDGGHIVFTLYEIITGRKPSDKFLYVMQLIGMILIFGLMFLAFGNDIARLLR